MFWNRKPKYPVTPNDLEWIEENLSWIEKELNSNNLYQYKSITPTKDNFKHKFQGNEEDAYFVLNRLMKIMNIDGWEIELSFYSEQPTELGEGLTATPSDNLDGSWVGSAGTYEDFGVGNKVISIEIGQLKNVQGLISVIAHELAHYILLGQNVIQENDEALTDLVAIYYGFGIVMINSKFNFSQWQGSTHQGWSMNSTGYLPEPIIAYSLALLSTKQLEELDFKMLLTKNGYKLYQKSVDYINDQK